MSGRPIIVALDYADAEDALNMAGRLEPAECRVKVGNELFTRAGPDLIRRLVASRFEVFLDLKFHDIPNTVANACAAAADLGVWMLNVHAAGGMAMMTAARAAVGDGADAPRLIAVTVLTSLDDDDLVCTGVHATAAQQVLRLARLGEDAGLDGVVCSPRDLSEVVPATASTFLKVTPGVRPAGSETGDQKRTATPAAAMQAGATHLVIGRPITRAADPMAALARIQAELAGR
jgi:orotidine-5'-phosphate decarboxylase